MKAGEIQLQENPAVAEVYRSDFKASSIETSSAVAAAENTPFTQQPPKTNFTSQEESKEGFKNGEVRKRDLESNRSLRIGSPLGSSLDA